jgi:methylenetetrahydrofolate dehydrogenase (NADP+)/methenyltetrahydrofolate cyclohydrolase
MCPVTASLLDGRAVAADIRREVAARVAALAARGVQPGLAGVLVGDDEGSRIYLGSKRKACADVGMVSTQVDLPADISEAGLLDELARLNADPAVHGVIVQIPVPPHISELAVQSAIAPEKDVDGLNPLNVGLMVRGEPAFPPATPYGIVELLVRSGVPLEGAEVVVIGYGPLVGAPLSIMLTQDTIRGNATVTSCHVHTRDLATHTRRADILVAAAGVRGLVGADMVQPGAVVVDVGVHRTETGLVGDVRFDEVAEVASRITPVPGGVGPMTTAMLLVNTVTAAERAAG